MDMNPSDVVDAPDSASSDAGEVDGDRPERGGTNDPPQSETAPSSTSTSRRDQIKDMLFSTSPEKNLDNVEAPYDPERGGLNRVYRGIQKMVDVDGLPAVADVVLGFAEWLDLAEPTVGGSDSSESGDSKNSQNSQTASSESDRPDDLEAALEEVRTS